MAKNSKKNSLKNKSSRPNMFEVSRDIIGITYKKSDTLKDCQKKFFSIMRKHGIKQGTPSKGGGRICDNFDWTAMYTLWLNRLKSYFEMDMTFGDGVPKDLEM